MDTLVEAELKKSRLRWVGIGARTMEELGKSKQVLQECSALLTTLVEYVPRWEKEQDLLDRVEDCIKQANTRIAHTLYRDTPTEYLLNKLQELLNQVPEGE